MTFFASRRVAVCGGRFGLGPEGATFCKTMGERLALNPNIVLLNRGIKRGDKVLMIVGRNTMSFQGLFRALQLSTAKPGSKPA